MFALTEKALASSELSNNNIDPIQLYVENSSKQQVRQTPSRSSSTPIAPYQVAGHAQVDPSHNGGADDAKSIRSVRSSRSRRASMSSALPPHPSLMGPTAYGYGDDEDDTSTEAEDEQSYKARTRRNRRRSLSGDALPSNHMDGEDGYGYNGRDMNEEVPVYTNRPARRTSATGSKMDRRGSSGAGGRMPRRGSSGGGNASKIGKMSRRGSSGNGGAPEMTGPSRVTRRGSAGFGAGYGHGNANVHVPMPRRMSNGMPMPRRQSTSTKQQLQERVHPQAQQQPQPTPHEPAADHATMPTELKRFETSDSVGVHKAAGNGSPHDHESNAGGRPGQLQRNSTADSFEMRQMVQAPGNKVPSFTRRGGRRGQLIEGADEDESESVPASVSSNKDGDADVAEQQADDNFQPLQRNNTADSVDMKQMAQAAQAANASTASSARAPPQAAGARSRRGGRRGANPEVPASPVGGRRATLARHGTADSMTMGQMVRAVSSRKIEDKNEGPPTSVSTPTLGYTHVSADDEVGVEAGTADGDAHTGEAKPALAAITRRGGRRGENVERRRVVCRTGTSDSLEIMRTSLKPETSPEPTDKLSGEKDGETQEEAETADKQEKEETPARTFDGVNPDVLARMSHAASGPTDQEVSDLEDEDTEHEEEQEDPYGYGKTDTSSVYGYGNDAPSDSEASHGSRASGRSGRSMRRNSTIIRPDSNGNMYGSSQLLAGPPRVSDSDLEEESERTGGASEDDASPAGSAMYGYGAKKPHVTAYASAQDSGNESEGTSKSMSSARRTRRRNSCLIRPDRDQTVDSSLLENASPMSDRDMEPDLDDFNDPDSLLNRSRLGGPTPKQPRSFDSEEEDPLDEVKVKGIHPPSSNTAIESKPIPKQKTPWKGREQPFTSPRQMLTKEKLAETEKLRIQGDEEEVPDTRGNWGDVDLSMSDDESPSDSSKESYGASLYVDKLDGYRDIDRYKQKARRRASLELTCIDIEKFEPQLKTSKLSKFTPAVGCTNASDFLVRCFVARLRAGITVIKHNRSRWSKSHLRTLFLLPDGKTLSWRAAEGENLKGEKGKRPKLDLIRCVEVRHAWSRDPSTKKQTGTAVMRKRCKDGLASRSFALIFNKRTLDMTALTTDQCKLLMEGFTALCFRLHLDREEHSEADGGDVSGDFSSDWASTIFGNGSTASLSLTATSAANPASPWGL
jgi:hypothetical protein